MPKELRLKFGKRLRFLRRARDMTQTQLAEEAGISVNFVSLIERGEFAPSFETLDALAIALKVSVRDLFDFETPSSLPQ